MAIRRYVLGCPAWGLTSWKGSLFSAATAPADYLAVYAQVFNGVEGNTTFYALPKPETVARWRDQTPEGFSFCFKFPSVISHELSLAHAGRETSTFLKTIAPLQGRLGPCMIQLPPSFGPQHLGDLARYVKTLPAAFSYAVELRHRAFFSGGAAEQRATDLLGELSIDWITLDTRGLFAADRADRHVLAVQRRKPNLPVRPRHTGPTPILRFVPHPDFAHNRPLLEPWLRQLDRWLDEGKRPIFFMHAPDDAQAPQMARQLHNLVQALRPDIAPMPPWPGEQNQQLDLF